MESMINDFERIEEGKENIVVFDETLESAELRKEVVERLIRFENSDELQFWWEDRPLLDIFMNLYRAGCISLPQDPVERFRWIALLCQEMSNEEGFDTSEIILVLDFLPEELMLLFEETYGTAVLENALDIRGRLSLEGWQAVYPE